MTVHIGTVPETRDFLEVISRFGSTDLSDLQSEIRAYEGGSPLSRVLEEVLQRAACVAEANRIMARFG